MANFTISEVGCLLGGLKFLGKYFWKFTPNIRAPRVLPKSPKIPRFCTICAKNVQKMRKNRAFFCGAFWPLFLTKPTPVTRLFHFWKWSFFDMQKMPKNPFYTNESLYSPPGGGEGVQLFSPKITKWRISGFSVTYKMPKNMLNSFWYCISM